MRVVSFHSFHNGDLTSLEESVGRFGTIRGGLVLGE